MAVIDRPAPSDASRRARVGFWWLALSAVAIAVFAPLPYLTTSLQALTDNDNDLAANYVDRASWVQVVFFVHITFGGMALLLSPLQFVTRLRERAPRVHRICGRLILTFIGLAGLAGLAIARFSLAGVVGTLGFGTLAVLWISFGAAAFRAIRRGDVATHRRWATRTFALTYAAVTLRLWLGILIALQIAAAGTDGDVAFDRAYHVVPFLAWVPNLLVVEYILRRQPASA